MKRWVWWLIGGGAAGVLVCVPLGMFSGFMGEVGAPVLAVLCGLVFGFGVLTLVQRGGGCAFGVAVLIGAAAPVMLVLEAHLTVLRTYGVVEECRVAHAEKRWSEGVRGKSDKYVVDYAIACPSGILEETVDYFDRLESDEVDVYQLPPLRPVLARSMHSEPWLLWSPPLAMAALVGVGLLARRRDTDQSSGVAR
ncbi:hypothetical protein FKR81_36465 [Lentzea tibetensis]|uniref:Uncharacterized protein n=1 Tax=Lentzea tibetensis TaxID=2591470 RepID=A0A563EIP0_9PSEU|nr:hypothetical protein [Lentzea tibetensis]TWP46236.1 hypothetical protein FKR81_36465 [Lentzea tibetensis]